MLFLYLYQNLNKKAGEGGVPPHFYPLSPPGVLKALQLPLSTLWTTLWPLWIPCTPLTPRPGQTPPEHHQNSKEAHQTKGGYPDQGAAPQDNFS